MAKQRKLRTTSVFKKMGSLPTPDEVNNIVKEVSEVEPVTKTKTSPKPKPKKKPVTRKKVIKEPIKKMGRPPLEEKRVKYTTSLTEYNRKQLRLLAIERGVRASDILNDILENYFNSDNKLTLVRK